MCGLLLESMGYPAIIKSRTYKPWTVLERGVGEMSVDKFSKEERIDIQVDYFIT